VEKAGNAAHDSMRGDMLEAKTQARCAPETIKQAGKLVAPADALDAASTAALFASKTFPGWRPRLPFSPARRSGL
jgi:type II secretory pathway component PulJ